MAFTTTSVQPVAQPENQQPSADVAVSASILSALILALVAAKKTRKGLGRLKLKLLWSALKLRLNSWLKPQSVSTQTLIYILLGIVFIILLIIDPIIALVLALVALILILAGVI